jgi:hypothetical protein
MLEIILFVFLTLGCFALVFYFRVREQRYLKKKTKDALSKQLHEEIEQERSENIRKNEKFREELKKFGG